MGYQQNNPFSRFSYESPLNSFDSLVAKLMKQGKSKESATKIAGSVANAKMHGAGSGPTAKQKARHGVSRESSEFRDMPIPDIEKGDAKGDWVEKGTGKVDRYPDPRKKTKPPKRDLKAPTGGPAKEGEPGAKAPKPAKKGVSRQAYGGNKGDESRSKRDYSESTGGVKKAPNQKSKKEARKEKRTQKQQERILKKGKWGGNKGDESKSRKDFESPKKGVSRKVSEKRAKKMVEKGKGVMSYKIGGRGEGHEKGGEHNRGRFTKIKRKDRTGKRRTSYSSTELGKSMDVR